MKKLQFLALLLLFTGLGLSSCSDDDDDDMVSTSERVKNAVDNYADLVFASYDDSYNAAIELRTLINSFVENPTEQGFNACKAQWLRARVPYGQTEAYRFYGGPIDDEDGPEGLINAWPMDENFIDYVEGSPSAGLINDPGMYPNITKQILMDLNESISEESIFTGWHAIEFLLWGQDLFTDGPGRRPYTDYVAGGTASNQDRRGEYLKVVADLLVDNLAEVRSEWTISGSYRSQFVNLPEDEVLDKIFTSLGELSKGELSGERMFVAVDEQDQENEHSCFADNTNVDIEQNFQGIVNVYTGTYATTGGDVVSGESFDAIVFDLNPTVGQNVRDAITLARTKINLIPAPFDQAILNDANVILEAVTALEDLSDSFGDARVVFR